MIPLLLRLQVRRGDGPSVRLWLPLFLLWLLLLPVAVLLVPIILIIRRLNPLRTIAAGWSVLSAMRGTHLDIKTPDTRVFLHVY